MLALKRGSKHRFGGPWLDDDYDVFDATDFRCNAGAMLTLKPAGLGQDNDFVVFDDALGLAAAEFPSHIAIMSADHLKKVWVTVALILAMVGIVAFAIYHQQAMSDFKASWGLDVCPLLSNSDHFVAMPRLSAMRQ